MFIIFYMSLFSINQLTPMDRFRANIASTHAKVQFQCEFYYRLDYNSLKKQVSKFEQLSTLGRIPDYIVSGRWEFDGICEHYVARVTGGQMFDQKTLKGPVPQAEVLWDGDVIAYHYTRLKEHVIHVEKIYNKSPLMLIGPFTLKGFRRIDDDITNYFSDPKSKTKTKMVSGRFMDYETRNHIDGDFHRTCEIAYDNNYGFVHRYIRMIGFNTKNPQEPASVFEFFCLDIKLMNSGGFIPTEWITIGFHVNDFVRRYEQFTDDSKIEPSDSPQVIHFKVIAIANLDGPVKMDELEGVDQILAPGGFLTRKGGLKSMSIGEMKTLLGKKMIPSNKPISPKIDYAEKHEFDKPQHRDWTIGYWIGGMLLLALGWSFRSWRRSKALLLLFGFVFLSGCGSRPIAMLNASFLPERMIYDASKPALDLDLVVNNAGNRSVRIFSVNAGCSCRHVDTSKLPDTIRPGEDLKLRVSMNGGPNFSAQRFIFSFETDQGPLSSPVNLVALPNHSISPSSISLAGLYEGIEEKDEFVELMHREIQDPTVDKEKTDLIFPTDFFVELISTRKGIVAEAPEYSYVDTTYRISQIADWDIDSFRIHSDVDFI